MRWVFASLVLFLIFAMTASVHSQPTSGCSAYSTEVFDMYDERGRLTWDAPDMECVEYFDVTVSTPHGVRHIRGIGDINAATLMPRSGIAAVEAGVRASTARFADLGDYKISDVIILMTAIDDEPAELVDPDTGAWKDLGTLADANPARPAPTGLCPIRMFTLNSMSSADMQQAIAHELFHCVQFGSLRAEQIKFNANWWIEGSAMLFTNHVFHDLQPMMKRERQFRRSIEEQVPIHQMAYEAMYPFLWYNEQTGISGLLPLLRSMPASITDSAQIGALNAMLAPEQWLQFAKDVDDHKIRYLNGNMADFGDQIAGNTWTISTTSTQRRTLKTFVITPGWADYECGLWNNRLTPAEPNVAIKPSDSPNWQAWPSETDCRSKGSERYRTIALSTAPRNITFSLQADRTIACNNCLAAASVIDKCMVGTWEQTGGGPMEWLQRMGIPMTRDQIGKIRMTMRDDGSFISQPVGIDYQLTVQDHDGPIVADHIGQVAGTAGRWSASGGRLRACFDSGGQPSGTITTTYPQGQVYSSSFPGSGVAGVNGSTSYSCTGTTMRTTVQMPRGGPMVYDFSRVSPPPPGIR